MYEGYEFIKVVDVYKNIEEEVINEDNEIETITLHIPIKKKLKIPWFVRDLNKVHDLQPYYNDEGKFRKGYSIITHDLYGQVVVKNDYNKLKEIFNKKDQNKIYGFKQYKN